MNGDSQKEETSYVCLMESKRSQEKNREVTELKLTFVVTTIRMWAAESATRSNYSRLCLKTKTSFVPEFTKKYPIPAAP